MKNELEYILNQYLERLNERGIHGHKNNANRSHDGKYISGEPFDYEFLFRGVLYAFDAKECESSRFSLSNCKLHQVKNLFDLSGHGAKAFFLVYFKNEKKLIQYKVEQVRQWLASGIKSVKSDQGEEVNLCDMISIK